MFSTLSAKPNRRLHPAIAAALLALPALLHPAPISGEQCLPDVYAFQGYSFVHPLMIEPRLPGAALTLDFQELYNRFGRQEQQQADENIEEWRQRFCDIPDLEDIRSVIYGYSIDDYLEISTAMTMKGAVIDPILRQNAFVRYLIRHKCLETIDYLLFAKDCEPYVTRRDDPWSQQDKAFRIQQMDQLIDKGLSVFLGIQSHYLRLRYAYQIIRLAHYSGQHQRVLDLWDYLMPKIDHDPSKIEFWILGHKAGALLALGKHVEASYLYARVFLHCPGKRESAYRSFRIKTDEEWRQCMLLCQDDQERATLFAMRAYARDSKALEEMQAIYTLDPSSPYLEVLLAREIRKLERQFLGLEFNSHRESNRRYHGVPEAGIRSHLIALQGFVRKVNADDTVPNRGLWLVGQGYLELLAGDTYAAHRSFLLAREATKDKILLEQIEVFELANRIAGFQQPTPEVEEVAAEILLDEPLFKKYPSFPDFFQDKMQWLYAKNNRPGKGFLVGHSFRDLKLNPQEDLIDDVLALTEQKEFSRYERDLLRKEDNARLRKELIAMKTTMLFAKGELAAALEVFKKIDPTEWDDYGLFNPFIERYTECINCNLRDTSSLLNRGQIIEKLLDLEYQAQASREEGARYLYQLGLGYYNMSYFGYAWKAKDYFRSGVSLKRPKSASDPDVVPDIRFPMGNRENFDCSKALEYFELARKLSPDKELAAKAAFMAARCEQNQYFTRRAPRTYVYFDLLKRNYTDTQFYQFVVQECKYFKAYAAR